MTSAEAAEAMKRLLARDSAAVRPPPLPAGPPPLVQPNVSPLPDAVEPGDARQREGRGGRWASETNWPEEWRTKPGPSEAVPDGYVAAKPDKPK